MKIYTGNAFGEKLEKVKEYDLGIMISSSPVVKPNKDFREVNCALDNGAFPAYKKGYPFQEKVFWNTMEECYKLGIKLDFIVCPDIVGGGRKSLEFSIDYARNKLLGTPNLALVVQNDDNGINHMTPEMLSQYNIKNYFTYIFIGGEVMWKWNTAKDWINYAHKNNMKCHIGQVGVEDKIRYSRHIQADSIDSTSFARNESWNIIINSKSKLLYE